MWRSVVFCAFAKSRALPLMVERLYTWTSECAPRINEENGQKKTPPLNGQHIFLLYGEYFLSFSVSFLVSRKRCFILLLFCLHIYATEGKRKRATGPSPARNGFCCFLYFSFRFPSSIRSVFIFIVFHLFKYRKRDIQILMFIVQSTYSHRVCAVDDDWNVARCTNAPAFSANSVHDDGGEIRQSELFIDGTWKCHYQVLHVFR